MNKKVNIVDFINDQEKQLIQACCRKDLKDEQLFVFDINLCDNEIDKDKECFSVAALYQIAEMVIDKTGIIDVKNGDVVGKVYSAKVCCDTHKKTFCGDDYQYVKAKAFIIINDNTKPICNLIKNNQIQEVSISCSTQTQNKITFINEQGLEVAYTQLRDVAEVYEWCLKETSETQLYMQGYNDGYEAGCVAEKTNKNKDKDIFYNEGYEQAVLDLVRSFSEHSKTFNLGYSKK